MKPVIRYLLLAGIATMSIVMIYFYREYMGEDTNPATEHLANPLINIRLNAIVTDTSSSKGSATTTGVKIAYTDIDTKEVAGFEMNSRSQPAIAIGDTISKDKGEKMMLVYKKGGQIVTVPIE